MPGGDVEFELIRATAQVAVRRSLKDFLTVAGGREVGEAAVGRSGGQAVRRSGGQAVPGPSPDWDRVLDLAEFHGTVPLLQQYLSRLPEGIVPASVQQALRDRCRDIAARNLLLSGRLTRACLALQQAGIRVLALKGPTLAILAYGDLSLRQFNDIDLLVSLADFDRGLEVLSDMGYGFTHRITPSQRIRCAQILGQVLLHDAQGTLIELHTRLTETAYHFPLEFESLWAQRQSVVLHDQTVSTLGNEDLLLYLVVHGTKHDWPYLGWVVDLVRLVGQDGTIDWPRLLKRATDMRCRRILLLSLGLASETLGLELPNPVTQACQADRVAQRLAGERSRRLLGATDLESAFRIARFRLRSRERLRDGASYVWASVFSPHVKDWQAFNFPYGWEFLYPIARPFRLLLKHSRLLYRAKDVA